MNVNFRGQNVYTSQQKQQNNTSLKSQKQDISFKALKIHHEDILATASHAMTKDPAKNCLIQDSVQSVTVFLDTLRKWGKTVDLGMFGTSANISEIENKKQAKGAIKKAKALIKERMAPENPSLAFYIAPLNGKPGEKSLKYIDLKQVTPEKIIKEIKPEIEKITGTVLPEVDIPPINDNVMRPKFSDTAENFRRAIKEFERNTKLDEVQDEINTLTAKKASLTSDEKIKKGQKEQIKEIDKKINKLKKEKEGYEIDARIDEIKRNMKTLDTELKSLQKKRK